MNGAILGAAVCDPRPKLVGVALSDPIPPTPTPGSRDKTEMCCDEGWGLPLSRVCAFFSLGTGLEAPWRFLIVTMK